MDPEWITLVNERKDLIHKTNKLKEQKLKDDETHTQDTKEVERLTMMIEKTKAGFGSCLAPLKKKGQLCQKNGHPFCGHHKKMGEEVAHIVDEIAELVNIPKEEVFHVQEKDEIVEFLNNWLARVKQSAENAALRGKITENDLKQAKEDMGKLRTRGRKVKGALESSMMLALKEELKVHPQELYGELTLVGNDCRKVVENYQVVLSCVEGHQDLHAKYSGLFSRLQEVIEMLFQVSPHFSVEVIESEAQIFQMGDYEEDEEEDEDEEEEEEGEGEQGRQAEEEISIDTRVKQSSVGSFKELVTDLGSYFHQHFVATGDKKAPLPKSHFLVYHAPQFLSRWLSLGMFSEQGCEALHSRFNVMKRKLINMGKEKAQEQTIKKHNLKYSVRWGSWKRRRSK